MSRPLPLHEMIQKYGPDKVKVQFLDKCTTNLGYTKKKGASVKFLTDQISPEEMVSGDLSQIGLVVWFDRKEYEKIIQEAIND